MLADVPVWKVPGLEYLHRQGVYATWLEAIIPEFANVAELEMHWVCFSKEVTKDLRHKAWGQHFYVLKRGKKSISMVTGYWTERRMIKRCITNINPDVIHSWGTEDVYGLAGARLKTIPKLFSIQGCLSACIKNVSNPPWLMRLQAAYERYTVKSFKLATGESQIAVDHLTRMNSNLKTHIIDYGVHRDFFDAKWQPANEPNLIFVGSVTEAKGIRELIEVMSSSELQHIKIKIAGDGDLLEELQAKDMPNVEWLGRLSREALIRHLETAWVICIPTYADTGPSVLKEARVVGLPVITTNKAGAASYIEDQKSGFLIKERDVEGLKNAIMASILSKEKCRELGLFGWLELRDKLHSSHTIRKFTEIYQNEIDERSQSK